MNPTQGNAALADSTRDNILEIAASEFADKGLAGARIDEIAEKTNSSKRMIYYYFGGKDGLYRAVLAAAYRGIREQEAARDFALMDAAEALEALVVHTFDYHLDRPQFVRLVMNENILRGAHIDQVEGLKERNRSVVAALKTILDKGVAEGVFRTGIDPAGLHLSMSALCFYHVANRYTVRAGFGVDFIDKRTRRKRRDEVVAMVLASVRA